MTFFMQSWQWLIPDLHQFLLPIGLALVFAQFYSLAQLIPGSLNYPIEIRLSAVWGGVVLFLTMWGSFTQYSLVYPTVAILIVSLAIWLNPKWRPRLFEMRAIGRLLLTMITILLVMLTLRPSSMDSFFNLLPNAQYLWDFNRFPNSDTAVTNSVFPALPYNTQLVGYLISWWMPFYPTAAVSIFNVLMQGLFALFIARVLTQALSNNFQPKSRSESSLVELLPSYGAIALSLLLITLFSPGFRFEYLMADHGEATTMVLLAWCAWYGVEIVQNRAMRQQLRSRLIVVGLLLAALVNVRQSNAPIIAALAGGLFAVAILQYLSRHDAPWQERQLVLEHSIAKLLAAILLPLFLWLVWRSFVNNHFSQGELELLPMSQWQLDRIANIVMGMFGSIQQRPFLFGLYILMIAYGTWLALRRILIRKTIVYDWRNMTEQRATALAVSFAKAIVIWNLLLVILYLAVNDKLQIFGASSEQARSYFRYNSHFIFFAELVIIQQLIAHGTIGKIGLWLRTNKKLLKLGSIIVITFVLVSPFLFLRQFRYDLQMPRPIIWNLAQQVQGKIGDNQPLVIFINGNYHDSTYLTLSGTIAMSGERKHGITFQQILMGTSPDGLSSELAKIEKQQKNTTVVLVCSPSNWHPDKTATLQSAQSGQSGKNELAAGHSALFQFNNGKWQVEDLGAIMPNQNGKTYQGYWAKSFQRRAFCLE